MSEKHFQITLFSPNRLIEVVLPAVSRKVNIIIYVGIFNSKVGITTAEEIGKVSASKEIDAVRKIVYTHGQARGTLKQFKLRLT